MRTDPSPPRRRVDLRELPYGLGYVLALLVVGAVVGLAWYSSRDEPVPGWWEEVVSPAILWLSPFVFVFLVWRWVRRIRGRNDPPSTRTSEEA